MPESPTIVVLEQVKAVILVDGSHHSIHPGSLQIGALLYRSADGIQSPTPQHSGFVVQRTDGTRMTGPLSSLLAVIG